MMIEVEKFGWYLIIEESSRTMMMGWIYICILTAIYLRSYLSSALRSVTFTSELWKLEIILIYYSYKRFLFFKPTQKGENEALL